MLPEHKKTLKTIFADALTTAVSNGAADTPRTAEATAASAAVPPPIIFERPKVAAHGDIACNVALQTAKTLRVNPRQLAERLTMAVLADARAAGLIASAAVAGPGFINLRLSKQAHHAVIDAILNAGERFGHVADVGKGERVMFEFVSANPTGPLHVGHGRQAALGDVLANVFATQGWRVWREFYYNDAGVQINNLALSVQARAKGLAPGAAEWPVAAYNGEYIADIAADYLSRKSVAANDGEPVTGAGDPEDCEAIRRFAVAYLRHEQDIDLQTLGVRFDCYYLESSLYQEGHVEAVVAALVASGKTYEADGALWLRTTDYGDDKDRVMRKSDGSYTYFVPDIAYHMRKWQRGYVKAINIQGSDHHGTIARVRAGLQALSGGIPPGYPDYVLHKMVTVMREGREVKLSKRAGSYVTARDLVEWSGGKPLDAKASFPVDAQMLRRGRDAVRFFLISRKPDTEFVFDVDLAIKQSDENPVYYVQYAHARICSVLATWGGDVASLRGVELGSLEGDKAIALLTRLAEYPDVLAHAAEELAPHSVAFYLRDLAADFHSFYNAERVLVDDEAIKCARLALLAATRQVLSAGLALLGVSAPAKM